jgi:hypothetical protein
MNAEMLHRWNLQATLVHPNSYKSYWCEGDRLNDRLYTEDGRRIWARLTGERPQLNTHPSLQEEPFLVVGFIGIENDTSYSSYQLTACGKVIVKVYESSRDRDILGPVTQEAHFCNEVEIEKLFATIALVLIED